MKLLPSSLILLVSLLNTWCTNNVKLVSASTLPTIGLLRGAAAAPPPPSFNKQTIKTYIANRCQNPDTPTSAIWSWEGRLVDPSTGEVLANVEGIELVRTLSEIEKPSSIVSSSSDDNTDDYDDNDNTDDTIEEERRNSLWRVARGLRRLHDLKVKNMLTSTSKNNDWDYAGTVLCRKLFCYSSPHGSNKGLLLKEYKHHPNAPIRKVTLDEAVALYDTATTFISREGGREMEIVTEWPDGRWVQSCASEGLGVVSGATVGEDDEFHNKGATVSSSKQQQQQKNFPFGFTAYVKRSGRSQLPTLPERKQIEKNHDGSEKKSSIPRSKFIQFGQDEDYENRRFGARETYSYVMGGGINNTSRSKKYKRAAQEFVSNIGEQIGLWDFDFEGGERPADSLCTVQYTRYGEAPPWYAPGKMCTLELLGRRVDSVMDAPPLAATLAATQIPGFMSVHTPIAFEDGIESKRNKGNGLLDQNKLAEQMIVDTAAINAVKWFREPLQILHDEDSLQEDRFTRVVNKGLGVVNRIRSATTVSAAVEN